MMKKQTLLLGCSLLQLLVAACGSNPPVPSFDKARVVTNPMDIQYVFSPSLTSYGNAPRTDKEGNPAFGFFFPKLDTLTLKMPTTREELQVAMEYHFADMISKAKDIPGGRTAADPVVRYYHGKYYLFFSGANGYFSSTDMQHWKHIDTFLPAGVAPATMVYKDELYYVTSHVNRIFKTNNPDDGNSWVVAANMQPFKSDPKLTAHDPYIFGDDDGRVYFYWECDNFRPIKGVEYDTQNNWMPINDPDTLIQFNWEEYGCEVAGDRNEKYCFGGFNEGAILTKYDNRYYLQYATNGTEYDAYADGVYVSDNPLGPYEHMKTSPASIKLGGFTTGAGHGDTFQDKYGNWWHIATTRYGVRHHLERRISIYPLVFTPKGNMYALTAFADYPFVLPDKKVDFLTEDIHTGWMNLSIDKAVTASSSLDGFGVENAGDNRLRTWWSAQSGKPGEWLQMDLGHECTVYAIQPNFADFNFDYKEGEAHTPYRYTLEGSDDGQNWTVIADKSTNTTDNPHPLLVLDTPVKARYIRIVNKGQLKGNFSLMELRAFGFGQGTAPATTKITTLTRDDSNRRRIQISWEANPNATGYLLRWGAEKDELYTSMELYGQSSIDLGCFDRDTEYYFTLDTFNENGITRGTEIKSIR